MKLEIVSKLRESINSLESSIDSARLSLGKTAPDSVKKRLEGYSQLVEKQKILTDELEVKLSNNDGDLLRHVHIINGISQLIREDAESVFNELTGKPTPIGDRKYDS